MVAALFSLTFVALGAATPVSALVDDAPADTEVVVRIDTGVLWSTSVEAWESLAPLLRILPHVEATLAEWTAALREQTAALGAVAGFDLALPGTTVTVVLDLDAKGGPVVAAVVRGPGAREQAPAGTRSSDSERSEVDGQPVQVLRGTDLAWSRSAELLVLGNERGVQRQLRHRSAQARDPRHACRSGGLCVPAQLVRDPGVFALALVGGQALSTWLVAALGEPAGRAASGLAGLALRTRGQTLVASFTGRSDRQRDALEHALRAVVAALQGAGSLALAGVELASAGAPWVPRRLASLPPSDVEEALVVLRGWRLDALVHSRPHEGFEVELTPSSYRGLLVAGVVALGGLGGGSGGAGGAGGAGGSPGAADGRGPDSNAGGTTPLGAAALLVRLRAAEQTYKGRSGHFLACPAEPALIPQKSVILSRAGCLAQLDFSPGPLVWQLAAELQDGKLVLVARGAPSGAALEVWYLDEASAAPRRVGAPFAPERSSAPRASP